MHDSPLHEPESPPADVPTCPRGGQKCQGMVSLLGCLNCGWPVFFWSPLPSDPAERTAALKLRQLCLCGT